LVFCAPESRSNPAKVTIVETAGFFITPSVTFSVIARVRSREAAGGRAVTRKM
jgi:hypothetical protein